MKLTKTMIEDLPRLTEEEKRSFYHDGEFKIAKTERLNDAFDRIEEESYGVHQNSCEFASRG